MEEKEVLKVVQKFLASQKIKFYRQKGSGPDILLESGGVVETKGKGFDMNRATEQFVRYPLTYPKLYVAMCADGLNTTILYVLYILEKSLKTRGKPSIGVYVIAKVEETKYKVRAYDSSEEMFHYVSSKLEEKLNISSDTQLEEELARSVETIRNIDSELCKILEEDATSVMGYEVTL